MNKMEVPQINSEEKKEIPSIEELQKINEKLEQRIAELEKSMNEESLLNNTFIHHIKNNFNSIFGLLDVMHDKNLTEDDKKQYLGLMEKSVNEAYMRMEDYLTFKKLGSGKLELNVENFDIKEFLIPLIQSLQFEAELKNIAIKNESENLNIKTSKTALRSVIKDLVSNALKFTQKGGEVVVSSSEDEGSIYVSVKDNGVGMTEEQIKNAFKLGITTDGVNGEKGTGIGLSNCQGLMKKMGGDIKVESEGKDKGTTFTLSFPK